jgi:hypothetical protein
MSRLKFDPFAVDEYPTRAAFPDPGAEGFLYKAEDTGSTYLYKNGTYESFSGSAILDGTGSLMPRRGALQLSGAGTKLIDDAAGDKTIVSFEYLKPFSPSPLAPENGVTGTALFVRLKITPYEHPIGIPIGGTHWQVAMYADFTTIVFDKRIVSASDSIVVTEDEMTVPYLVEGVMYYWRARYFDLKDTDSDWSDAWHFTVSPVAGTETILQPDIMYPVSGGWMPEKKLLVQLSQPVSLGTLAPDKMDVQVSMTPDFGALDILEDYQDYADTRLLLDDTADFSTAPSPLYLRARHKDSIAGVSSAWSSIPTVWLQRAYTGLVFGWEERLMGDNGLGNVAAGSLVLNGIDEGGNLVSYPSGYFENHPAYAGLKTNVQFAPITDDGYGNCDMAFIPVYYYKFWQDPNDAFHRKYFYSPVPKDGYDVFPTFLGSGKESGFYMGRTLNTVVRISINDSTTIPTYGVRSDLTKVNDYTNRFNTAHAVAGILKMNSGDIFAETGWHVMNIWERTAVTRLMIAEALTYNIANKFGGGSFNVGSDGYNTEFPANNVDYSNFHDIYALVQPIIGTQYAKNEFIYGVTFKGANAPFVSSPYSQETAVDVGIIDAVTGQSGGDLTATRNFAGLSSSLGFDVSILNIPSNLSAKAIAVNDPYYLHAYGSPTASNVIDRTSVGISWPQITAIIGDAYSSGVCRVCKDA